MYNTTTQWLFSFLLKPFVVCTITATARAQSLPACTVLHCTVLALALLHCKSIVKCTALFKAHALRNSTRISMKWNERNSVSHAFFEILWTHSAAASAAVLPPGTLFFARAQHSRAEQSLNRYIKKNDSTVLQLRRCRTSLFCSLLFCSALFCSNVRLFVWSNESIHYCTVLYCIDANVILFMSCDVIRCDVM